MTLAGTVIDKDDVPNIRFPSMLLDARQLQETQRIFDNKAYGEPKQVPLQKYIPVLREEQLAVVKQLVAEGKVGLAIRVAMSAAWVGHQRGSPDDFEAVLGQFFN